MPISTEGSGIVYHWGGGGELLTCPYQRCDSCLMASHNLSHLKIFKMSQGSLNCHSFFGAFCMFKSHQLCLCHICETQYLSVITMNSIILQFVKKGTTT